MIAPLGAADARSSRRPATAAWLLSGLLTASGTLHFVAPSVFESIVPRFLGSPATWVFASGVAELGCAAALAVPSTRARAGLAAAALFVAVFPANVQMALDSGSGHHDLAHSPLIAWGRLPLQIPLVAWALYVARTAGRNGA